MQEKKFFELFEVFSTGKFNLYSKNFEGAGGGGGGGASALLQNLCSTGKKIKTLLNAFSHFPFLSDA